MKNWDNVVLVPEFDEQGVACYRLEEPEYPPYMLENSIENIGSFRKRSYKDIITGEWPVAISKDLLRLKDMILNEKNGNQSAQQGLLRSQKWAEMTKAFGYAALVNEPEHQVHKQ